MMKKNRMKKILAYPAGFAAAAGFLCGLVFLTAPKGNGAEIVDRVVAVVNEDIISLFELNQMAKPYEGRIKALNYTAEQEKKLLDKIRDDVLNRLIDERLAGQEIKRAKIQISEEEIDRAIGRFKTANGYSDQELTEALQNDGMSMTEYRTRVREQVLIGKLVNLEVKSKIVVTKKDIELYYKQHPEKYGGKKKYRLRHILMKVPSAADEDEKRVVQKKMEAVLARLKEGRPFEKMADIYSETSTEEGGLLGVFELDDLSPRLKEAIKRLNAGEFTEVLETDYGYQIFFLEKIINRHAKPIRKVYAEIESKLRQQIINDKYQSWLEDLRKRSHIKIIK